MGQCEVELRGRKEDVMDVIENRLDDIIGRISLALKSTLPTEEASTGGVGVNLNRYPTVVDRGGCAKAVIDLLSTDWGREPRTSTDLLEAMRANGIPYPKTTLSGVLQWLTKKGKLRRWREGRSYVYVLRGGD
ncbi:MAG: hypothetical protein ACE5OY_02085 [Candidatus Bathyarchaeia archaeon]